MRMPDHIDAGLLGVCGINCVACYRHVRQKASCPGCLVDGEGKQGHCVSCAIKRCAAEKGLTLCARCAAYPCQRVKRLAKAYQTRYDVDLLTNGRTAASEGADAFLAADRGRWLCPGCGGIINQHTRACSECGQP